MAVFKKKSAVAKAKKGEFETSEQFQQRIASVGNDFYAFRFAPGEVNYDADKKVFVISLFFSDVNYNWVTIDRKSGQLKISAVPDDPPSAGLMVSDKRTRAGRYVAANAFGVKATVERYKETVLSIVVARNYYDLLNTKLVLSILPERAAKLKPFLSFSAVCRPAARPNRGFTMTATRHETPEITSPFDSTITYYYLFADDLSIWAVDSRSGEILEKLDLVRAQPQR